MTATTACIRPPELGQTLAVSILFGVYEPGIRLAGYVENGDIALLEEGTEQGLFTLLDWMDDCMALLLKEKRVPGTDSVCAGCHDCILAVYGPELCG